MHLSAVSKIIDLFSATGHGNYAKSTRLHLQQILELETTYPWVYANFSDHGYHTVRHSDRCWAWPWKDLMIGQVLAHALKKQSRTYTWSRCN